MLLFQKYLCRDGALGFNNSLFLRQTRESMDSEFELAYLMRRRGCLPDGVSSADIDKILQFYFQVCRFASHSSRKERRAIPPANN